MRKRGNASPGGSERRMRLMMRGSSRRSCARALHTEIDRPLGSPWGRHLATSRAAGAKLLAAEIDNVPDEVRHLLRPRLSKEIGADATLDAGEVAKIEAKLVLTAACRSYASELAVSETTRRITLDLQNYFDSGTQIL